MTHTAATVKTRPTPSRTRAYRFFRAHAGYRVGYHAMDALALAKAEQWAQDSGMEYQWEEDAYGDLGGHECWCLDARREAQGYGENGETLPHYHEPACNHDLEACVAWYNGEVQASLCGIIDADSNYRRVVEAELALEAMETAARFVYY